MHCIRTPWSGTGDVSSGGDARKDGSDSAFWHCCVSSGGDPRKDGSDSAFWHCCVSSGGDPRKDGSGCGSVEEDPGIEEELSILRMINDAWDMCVTIYIRKLM